MSTATTIDPITMEILASGFHHIAEEMAVVEYRASYSPIIREMLDFNCGLFTGDGRMVANSEQIPAQLGLMQFALEAAREKWGEDIAEGDAVLTNHPYMGGTHTPDLQVFTPLYRDGRIIAWAGSIAHHIDIGGRFPGTESAQCTELFQEGLIFPAVKLVERGTRVRALYDLISANVRDPASTLGDLDAQLAACRRGMARIDELADAHGTDTVLQGMETLLHTTALRADAAFRSWPDRTVTAEGFLGDEGFEGTSPVRVHAAVHVDDGTLVVDLSGSSPQIASGMNVPISSAHAGTYFAVAGSGGVSVARAIDNKGNLREPSTLWTGDAALKQGLIDGLGEARATIRARYGADAKLALTNPRRGWLRRRLRLQAEPAHMLEETLAVLEARAQWQRFGL